ncbi:MAG: GNAT family N-acetyltransferase [Candidatus Aenigmarchaeota archaeon]|nr:GNAT family N-acetyltransferase [Candidatus Aenigmarchaeota archaeon]NIP40554.1 GNAT family N-acetyltransferase [Candidatus Aenigmarchaeota archaeon]NIQ18399.1 GNAT family N-acetyltransferase [Candidatus Aenigmarchaeota archaeon]
MNPDFRPIEKKELSPFRKDWKRLNEQIGIEFKDNKYYFGIFVEGKIIGYVYFRIMGGRCYMDEFMIKEEFRREGIGTKTFEWLEDFAGKKDCHKMLLKTTNKHLILNLAKRLGYKEEAILKDDAFHLDWIYLSKAI